MDLNFAHDWQHIQNIAEILGSFVTGNKFTICIGKTCHTNLRNLNILLKIRKYPINSYLPQIIRIFNKK